MVGTGIAKIRRHAADGRPRSLFHRPDICDHLIVFEPDRVFIFEGLIANLCHGKNILVYVNQKPRKRRRRKAVSEPELGIFLRQYGRKAPKSGEPNDRGYSRKVEQRIKRMSAEELDELMRGEGTDDD